MSERLNDIKGYVQPMIDRDGALCAIATEDLKWLIGEIEALTEAVDSLHMDAYMARTHR